MWAKDITRSSAPSILRLFFALPRVGNGPLLAILLPVHTVVLAAPVAGHAHAVELLEADILNCQKASALHFDEETFPWPLLQEAGEARKEVTKRWKQTHPRHPLRVLAAAESDLHERVAPSLAGVGVVSRDHEAFVRAEVAVALDGFLDVRGALEACAFAPLVLADVLVALRFRRRGRGEDAWVKRRGGKERKAYVARGLVAAPARWLCFGGGESQGGKEGDEEEGDDVLHGCCLSSQLS